VAKDLLGKIQDASFALTVCRYEQLANISRRCRSDRDGQLALGPYRRNILAANSVPDDKESADSAGNLSTSRKLASSQRPRAGYNTRKILASLELWNMAMTNDEWSGALRPITRCLSSLPQPLTETYSKIVPKW